MEVWKRVEDAKYYEVSDTGRIRNSVTNRVLKTRDDGLGYQIVNLRTYKGAKTFKIHRLVATAFNAKSSGLHYMVDHIDGDPSNNNSSNLRWVTPKENANNPNNRNIIRKTYTPLEKAYIEIKAALSANHSVEEIIEITRRAIEENKKAKV